ncbi:hypothetical protein EG347_09970 [Chryseobacterium sp. G0186]|nr:hypothetical protein EG347_09970 [Chryseobacterium sp. G0186]
MKERIGGDIHFIRVRKNNLKNNHYILKKNTASFIQKGNTQNEQVPFPIYSFDVIHTKNYLTIFIIRKHEYLLP